MKPLELALERFAQQFDQWSLALLGAQSESLEQSSTALYRNVIELAQLVQPRSPARQLPLALELRARELAALLACRRENLLRLTSSAQRALAELVPNSQASTYLPPAARATRYAGVAQQSGEFKALAV